MVVKMDKMLQKTLLQLLLLLLHVKTRNEAKAESTISYLVHTHVFVLQALDSSSVEFFYTTFLSINFNNMTRGKMIHLKPIHYDRWWKRKKCVFIIMLIITSQVGVFLPDFTQFLLSAYNAKFFMYYIYQMKHNTLFNVKSIHLSYFS